jgi:hypothetical protein
MNLATSSRKPWLATQSAPGFSFALLTVITNHPQHGPDAGSSNRRNVLVALESAYVVLSDVAAISAREFGDLILSQTAPHSLDASREPNRVFR